MIKELSFKGITGKKELHEALKTALDFPEWYGNNLDALFDALTDVSEDVTLVLTDTEDFKAAEEKYFNTFVRVLSDAAEENEHFTVEVKKKKVIDETKILPFNFFSYGGTYTGQYLNMRYKLKRIGEKPDFQMEARVWKGPFASDVQEEDAFTIAEFPFTIEGRIEAIAWIQKQYDENPEKWAL